MVFPWFYDAVAPPMGHAINLMKPTIHIEAIDRDGDCIHTISHCDTIKEAKQLIRETLLEKQWWNRLAENTTFAPQIASIIISKDGETHSEFPVNFA